MPGWEKGSKWMEVLQETRQTWTDMGVKPWDPGCRGAHTGGQLRGSQAAKQRHLENKKMSILFMES